MSRHADIGIWAFAPAGRGDFLSIRRGQKPEAKHAPRRRVLQAHSEGATLARELAKLSKAGLLTIEEAHLRIGWLDPQARRSFAKVWKKLFQLEGQRLEVYRLAIHALSPSAQ